MSNVFAAKTDYIEKNPKVIEFFLKMWQEGVDAWHKDRASVIKSYPDEFAIKSDKAMD